MVARCFIPTCNCEFRELSKGRLFVLPPNRDFSESMSTGTLEQLINYCYWLCPKCAAIHTLTRLGSEIVISERERSAAPSLETSARGAQSRLMNNTQAT